MLRLAGSEKVTGDGSNPQSVGDRWTKRLFRPYRYHERK
jgi:hypothetical protein